MEVSNFAVQLLLEVDRRVYRVGRVRAPHVRCRELEQFEPVDLTVQRAVNVKVLHLEHRCSVRQRPRVRLKKCIKNI